MTSNQGPAGDLVDFVERGPDVIARLRGEALTLPWGERLKFADKVAGLSGDLADLAKRLRLSAFQDGSLPPDNQI